MKIKHHVQKTFETTDAYAGIDSVERCLRGNSFLVVMNEGSFIGILTPFDIIESPHRLVIDCLHKKPHIDCEQNIESVLKIMKESQNYVLPVFDGNVFIGIVLQTAITKFLFEYRKELERVIDKRTSQLSKANKQLKQEIEEHKLAEEALRESEQKYRTITSAAQDAIVMMDNEGNVSYWNPAAEKIFGYTTEEANGKELHIFLGPSRYHEDYKKGFKKFKGTGQGVAVGKSLELSAIRKDGTEFPIELSVSAIQIKGKWRSMGIVRDITDKKLAEEEKEKLLTQFQQAQKMEAVGTLAGGIAHNFNNLLMGIQGNTSLMFEGIDSSHLHYNRLKSIEKQIQSGVKLTSQLLGYARKGKYEVTPISLNKLVKEISYTFGMTRKEIVIHQKLAEDLLAIEADQGQIEQVLLNLFVNAADAMPSGGDLILESMNVTHKNLKSKLYKPKAGNYVMLIVKDTGMGMDKSTAKRIFDPFFTTKKMGRGTGLGLASVYGIIKAHGGYIDVKSIKKHGTSFRIYLPASKRKVRKVTKTSDKLIKGTGTVLLVDDEEVVRVLCKELLETTGYRVFSAKDGQEAIEIYKDNMNKIDIVLLDMIMPNMSGGEVYDRMKEINPAIKVLLSTGYSIDGEATEILGRGCDGFIQKPFDIKKLSAKIRKILKKA